MIAVDANIVIYALTGSGEFAEPSRILLRRVSAHGGVASVLLLSEVLSQADLNQPAARREVEDFLTHLRGMDWAEVSRPIAIKAAELMRQYPKKLHLADAIHLATATIIGADEFWTNDKALLKVSIPGLKIKSL